MSAGRESLLSALNVERHDDPNNPADCIGQWCCGCSDHPIGKPWGWNWAAWETHYLSEHPYRAIPGRYERGVGA